MVWESFVFSLLNIQYSELQEDDSMHWTSLRSSAWTVRLVPIAKQFGREDTRNSSSREQQQETSR